jgi:GABA permease
MINPLRSEEDAFRFTLIVGALLAPVALVAIIWSTGAALAVAGGLAIGLVVGLFLLKNDEPREKMLLGRRLEDRADGRYRILVVANETLSGRALRNEISERGQHGEALLQVVCPALNSRIKHWTNEEDAARESAGSRLQALLEGLRSEGFDADGDIGDDDPVQAMEDGLRRFPADEVIISTHPPGRSNWLERDVVERARSLTDVTVTHVVVDLEREGVGPAPAT